METVKIINALCQRLLREAVTARINTGNKYKVVAELIYEEELLEQVKSIDYDIILLSLENNQIEKYNIATQLLGMGITKLIIITQEINMGHVQGMLSLGIKGYITKNVTLDEYFMAIDAVHRGDKYIGKEIQSKLTDDFCQSEEADIKNISLSKRQREVLNLLKSGLTSIQIAQKLELSPYTIQVHRHNILKRLKMKNTASLIDYCTY